VPKKEQSSSDVSMSSSDLDRLAWAESIRFTSYGVRVGVRVDRKGVLDRIEPYLPPGWKHSRSRKVDRVYSVLVRGKGDSTISRFKVVYADGDQIAKTEKLNQAIYALESDVQLFVAETAPHRVFVHAGVVAVRDKAIVIPGRSFSGKTSLVAALVKAGAIYYSDEYAALDERGRVHQYPRRLAIRQNGRVIKTKRYEVEALGGRKGTKPLQVAMVIVSKYQEGARWRPRQLSDGEAALDLMANTVSARRRPEAMLEAIRRVVSHATVFKGTRGEADQVVDFVFEKMNS
jgi:hypothetical protein